MSMRPRRSVGTLCGRFVRAASLATGGTPARHCVAAATPSVRQLVVSRLRSAAGGTGVTVADYMRMCNAAAGAHGYYHRRRPAGAGGIFGPRGDFYTASEMTQVFGELLAAWLHVERCRMLGTGGDDEWILAELGPGSGALLDDIMRMAAAFSGGLRGLRSVHLLETSEFLAEQQAMRLCATGGEARDDSADGQTWYRRARSRRYGTQPVDFYWHRMAQDIPSAFGMYVSNELLDAFPIHQFARDAATRQWREVLVQCDGDTDELQFALAPRHTLHSKALIPPSVADDPRRTFHESCPDAISFVHEIAARVKSHGGAALFVDYGHGGGRDTPSLRAYSEHKHVDVLRRPGEFDLTADVDFAALRTALINPSGDERIASAMRQGRNYGECACVFGPVTQRRFLTALGAGHRFDYLRKSAGGDEQLLKNIERTEHVLLSSEEMGDRFKVIAIFPPTLGEIFQQHGAAPAGFA